MSRGVQGRNDMKDKVTAILLSRISVLIAGAAGAWVAANFTAAHQAFCALGG